MNSVDYTNFKKGIDRAASEFFTTLKQLELEPDITKRAGLAQKLSELHSLMVSSLDEALQNEVALSSKDKSDDYGPSSNTLPNNSIK